LKFSVTYGGSAMRAIQLLNARPRFVAFASIAVAGLYVAAHLQYGWIPHDEGQLGQAAERTLLGELPHRDFDDMYTGGLSFLNALAFRWFGVDSASLRAMLWLFFVPTIGAYYYLASRVMAPVLAGLVTMLGAMLSLPVYSAPMPSWYNLFFAIMGVASLVRYVETARRRWLFAAGVCGGSSILFKITGLYFIAAGLLFLAYREQLLGENDARGGTGWYGWLASVGLVAFGALGLAFVRSGRTDMNAVHFTAPLMALAGFLLYRERLQARGSSGARLRRMLSMAGPFLLGAAVPVLGFALFYAVHGAVGDLFAGLFVLPRMRVESGAYPLPGIEALAISALPAGLLACGLRPAGPSRQAMETAALGAMTLLLMLSNTEVGFFVGFHSLRNVLPFLVAIAILMLLNADELQASDHERQLLFLIGAATALTGLIQYPHAYGIYFFYAAPLAALLAAYIVALQPFFPRRATAGLLGFYLAFVALQLNGPDPHRNVGWRAVRQDVEPMGLQRCSLTVPAYAAALYRELVAEVAAHSKPGSFILAGPDCPEVYYLAKRRNPSRVMYEFFRPDWLANHDRLFELLDEREAKVVVVNCFPSFSKPMSAELVELIARRFPHQHVVSIPSAVVGRTIDRFRIFWRE